MPRGYGGTMPIAFFPKKVEDKLLGLGFVKSKKGNYYKIYDDAHDAQELLAIPNCLERDGKKGIRWFIKTTGEAGRKVDWTEAIKLSMEFNADAEQIHDLIAQHNE